MIRKPIILGVILIFLLLSILSSQAIIENIVKSMKNNCKILYRTTWKGLYRLYGEESIPKNLKIKNIYHRIDGLKTLLLVNN